MFIFNNLITNKLRNPHNSKRGCERVAHGIMQGGKCHKIKLIYIIAFALLLAYFKFKNLSLAY